MSFYVLLLLLSFLQFSSSTQPNIIFIMADDLGYHDVGIQGSSISTPNIDKLAGDGVILKNHYVMPNCSPTRSAFMTGRHAIRTGFWYGNLHPTEKFGLGLSERTIPEMLGEYGYESHAVGKWHLGMYSVNHTPVFRGFKTFLGMYLGSGDYFQHTHASLFDFRYNFQTGSGNLKDIVLHPLKGVYSTEVYTNWTLQILDRHHEAQQDNTPLFIYLSYQTPHGPYQVPGEEALRASTQKPGGLPGDRRVYSSMITYMDQGIGRIVDRLHELNMADNTLIVFASDNGGVMGPSAPACNYPLRGGKGGFYEGGVRSFTFVHGSLLQKSGYTNINIHHITDWFPTFEHIAKTTMNDVEKRSTNGRQKKGKPLDGVNIWSSISNNEICRKSVLINIRRSNLYKIRPPKTPKNATDELESENDVDDISFEELELEEEDEWNSSEIEEVNKRSLRSLLEDLGEAEDGTEVIDEDGTEVIDEDPAEEVLTSEEGTELIDEDVEVEKDDECTETGTEVIDEDNSTEDSINKSTKLEEQIDDDDSEENREPTEKTAVKDDYQKTVKDVMEWFNIVQDDQPLIEEENETNSEEEQDGKEEDENVEEEEEENETDDEYHENVNPGQTQKDGTGNQKAKDGKKGKKKVTGKKGNPVTDLIVYRWKTWKLIVGNEKELYQGWKEEDKGTVSNINMSRLANQQKLFLYELTTDPRERRNLAPRYPHMLEVLLTKVRKYFDQIVPYYKREISGKGKRRGVWAPFVKYV